jgi:molybdopterin converting factor small subunit
MGVFTGLFEMRSFPGTMFRCGDTRHVEEEAESLAEISVSLHGALEEMTRQFAGERTSAGWLKVRIEAPVKVREVLARLGISDSEVHLAFIGKKRATLVDELQDGDTLSVFPPMAGG